MSSSIQPLDYKEYPWDELYKVPREPDVYRKINEIIEKLNTLI